MNSKRSVEHHATAVTRCASKVPTLPTRLKPFAGWAICAVAFAVCTTFVCTARGADGSGDVRLSGELKQWHKVTLSLDGPWAREQDEKQNPFLDYRMTVTFTHESGSPTYRVPGYFAADGDAANTSADAGTTWRAHLSPDKVGVWSYKVSFVAGREVAVEAQSAGKRLEKFDGKSGRFTIGATDKSGRDFRGKGRLNYVGERYLQFAGTKEWFLKQGADAPENLLAYADFDGPQATDGHMDNLIKDWAPHIRDWKTGDPSWGDGKGRGLIGAINYLASEGMNAFSFLTLNIQGDDQNVFPYVDYDQRLRMDVSRLDQWEIIFEHGDRLGMFLHFKTLETENELLLDKGDLGLERKLYYRELIARFAHHLALNWNLGEEINNATTRQKQSWAGYFWENDPYQHHIVIHNGANHYDLLGPYDAVAGTGSEITGFSLQTSSVDFSDTFKRVTEYLGRSAKAGKQWAVALDEPGDASHSLRPDDDAGNSHEDARKNALWATFLAGGWGNEWYFGYRHAHSDLTLTDFRSRDKWWDYARYALEFFHENKVPVWEMHNDNKMSSSTDGYVLTKPGEVYVVYLKQGGTTELNLSGQKGAFDVKWFDPRHGGKLLQGSAGSVNAGKVVSLGTAPSSPSEDWVILVRRR